MAKQTNYSPMIHTVERKECPQCHALMIAEINREKISYRCVYKHQEHPPEHFRDKANGE